MNTAANASKKNLQTKDLALIGVFAAVMAVCSWISIPAAVPFTLQTFGVFIAMEILGGKRGTLSVLVFLLMGAAGLPVFSGMRGGIQVLMGPTGGYIVGFLAGALLMWLLETVMPKHPVTGIVSMTAALLACYALGTVWFMAVYSRANGPVGLMTVLGWCVFPFIVPDLIKIMLAYVLGRRLRRYA